MSKYAYPLVILYTVISAIVFGTFAVLWLVNPDGLVPNGVDGEALFAQFASGRNIAIDIMVIVLIVLRKKEVLAYFLLTMAMIQTYDAGLGLYIGEPTSAIAPILNAALYVVCAVYLLRVKRTSNPRRELVSQ